MIKKVISFTILLVIFLLGFQFLISFLKTNHNIIYDLEIEGEIYSIDETYKKISGRDYYLFNVSIGDSNFLFKSDNYFNKQKKVVDSIKKYSNDNVTCISLIYKNNYASAPLCIKDNNENITKKVKKRCLFFRYRFRNIFNNLWDFNRIIWLKK